MARGRSPTPDVQSLDDHLLDNFYFDATESLFDEEITPVPTLVELKHNRSRQGKRSNRKASGDIGVPTKEAVTSGDAFNDANEADLDENDVYAFSL